MAYLATLHVLVDDDDESRVLDGLNEMLRAAQAPVQAGDPPWIVDWSIAETRRANDVLQESIASGTYEEGDLSKQLVIFSPSEAIAAGDGAGFWSNDHGWTSLDLATRFDAAARRNLPHSAAMDAVWMHAPHGLSFHRLMVLEPSDVDAAHPTPIAFDCWAQDSGHAAERALNAYPGCSVASIE